MIKYEIPYWGAEITAVEVEKETARSVWIDGRRRVKADRYFDTWDGARDYLVEMSKEKMVIAERGMASAKKFQNEINALRKPEA